MPSFREALKAILPEESFRAIERARAEAEVTFRIKELEGDWEHWQLTEENASVLPPWWDAAKQCAATRVLASANEIAVHVKPDDLDMYFSLTVDTLSEEVFADHVWPYTIASTLFERPDPFVLIFERGRQSESCGGFERQRQFEAFVKDVRSVVTQPLKHIALPVWKAHSAELASFPIATTPPEPAPPTEGDEFQPQPEPCEVQATENVNKRGPKPRIDQQQAVLRVIKQFYGDNWTVQWKLKMKLPLLAEALDEAQVPVPRTWQRRRCRTWQDGLDEDRSRFIKAVSYCLTAAQRSQS